MDGIGGGGDNPPVMIRRNANSEFSLEAIAIRLQALRAAWGYTGHGRQRAFAELMGITPQAWNNYERAGQRIGLDQALLVVRKTGVTLDWIYRGEPAGLPQQLRTQLAEEELAIKSA